MSFSYNEEYKAVTDETRELLNANPEWRGRYAGYANEIKSKINIIRNARDKFNEWKPLYLYLTVSQIKKANDKKITFNLQYLGQIVAELTCKAEQITLSTKNYEQNNEEHFNCSIPLADVPWDSPDAHAFRAYFRNRVPFKRVNQEKRLESLLLTEFSEKKDKIKNIQPVKIAADDGTVGVRFSMPQPLYANKPPSISYSGEKSKGGIDLLTRTGIGGNANLCIMELKDEYESADKVLAQALAYTVFIRELLRSESGEEWWKLFGFNRTGRKPFSGIKKLVLYATCVMPYSDEADKSFLKEPIHIDGDTIRLHYAYFEESDNEIKSIDSSLPHTKPKGICQ